MDTKKRKVNYGLSTSEIAARIQGYDFLLNNHMLPKEITECRNLFLRNKLIKKLQKSWRIVLIPKEQHPMIYPEGGKYNNGRPYIDAEDPYWGAYKTIPCIEVTDKEGNIICYEAFDGLPDICCSCFYRIGKTTIIPKCRGLYLCGIDRKLCVEKIIEGCKDCIVDTPPI